MSENYYPATRRDKQGRALAFSTTSDRVFNPTTGASVKAEMGEVSSLSTTAKTVVPAINENKASIDTLNQNLPRVLHGTTQLNVSPYIGHVTFATPMSNTDYVIILTPRCTSALTGGEPAYGPAVFNKTVNGFDYTSGGAASTTNNWYVDWTVIY